MKLVKKTKNLYFFECDSKKELDTLVTKQVTSDIRDKSHTTLLLTPSHELEKIYESIICDYKNRLVGFKSACAYITEEFLDLSFKFLGERFPGSPLRGRARALLKTYTIPW